MIGMLVAYNDPELLSLQASGNATAAASPFVIAISRAGIKGIIFMSYLAIR